MNKLSEYFIKQSFDFDEDDKQNYSEQGNWMSEDPFSVALNRNMNTNDAFEDAQNIPIKPFEVHDNRNCLGLDEQGVDEFFNDFSNEASKSPKLKMVLQGSLGLAGANMLRRLMKGKGSLGRVLRSPLGLD